MKTFTFPHSIRSGHGEQVTFLGFHQDGNTERVLFEAEVAPGAGPNMHTHWQQDESVTVVSGRMGWQFHGQSPEFAVTGETVVFPRGTPHRFWNEGNEILICKGWISPPNDVIYVLDALYAAMRKSPNPRPEIFDGAWILTTYATEYDITDVPRFVRKVIFPLVVCLGRLLGKYDHFREAPAPRPAVRR